MDVIPVARAEMAAWEKGDSNPLLMLLEPGEKNGENVPVEKPVSLQG